MSQDKHPRLRKDARSGPVETKNCPRLRVRFDPRMRFRTTGCSAAWLEVLGRNLLGRKVAVVRSGGQSGVDRAALHAAVALGLPVTGWVPQGGWAEDSPEPPGVLAEFPELRQTPSPNPSQRTLWNVRNCDAVLVLRPPSARSPGTGLTEEAALELSRPLFVVEDFNLQSVQSVIQWLSSLDDGVTLNVAGPRESEVPGVYEDALTFLKEVLAA